MKQIIIILLKLNNLPSVRKPEVFASFEDFFTSLHLVRGADLFTGALLFKCKTFAADWFEAFTGIEALKASIPGLETSKDRFSSDGAKFKSTPMQVEIIVFVSL